MNRASQAFAALLGCVATAAWAAAPVLVAPGAAGKTLVANSSCPTFSWGTPPAEVGIELLVFPVSADRSPGETPVLRVRLPAGATAWTPSADRCLAPGDYAWSLRAVGDRSGEGWEEALFFTVDVDAAQEVRRLKRMVEELSQRPLRGVAEGARPAGAPLPTAQALPMSPVDWIGSNSLFPPVTCGGTFDDVAAGDPFCPWIEAAYLDGFLQACADAGGSLRFCSNNAVTRQQAAVFVERLRHGSAGGVLSGSYPDPDLSPAFKLPESCLSGALAEWSGSAWICSCGSLGKACCAGDTCVTGTVCNGNVCAVCGGFGESCCAGDSCDPGGVCSGGACAPCGAVTQLCCAGDTCDPGGVCNAGFCTACGSPGQSCCAGNTCDAGSTCSGGLCTICGGLGQACCEGNSCTAGTCTGGVCQP